MEPFKKLRAVAAPIDITNLDTNQLCPTRFNKIPLTDPDYQRILFNNQRYQSDGTLTDFILNRPPYRDSQILVGDENFGCGSSREQAPLALKAAGVSAVVASYFARIFCTDFCTDFLQGFLHGFFARIFCTDFLHGFLGVSQSTC